MATAGIKLILGTERFQRKQQSEAVELRLNWDYLDHLSPAEVLAS